MRIRITIGPGFRRGDAGRWSLLYVEWLGSDRCAVGPKRDLLDANLRFLEEAFAMFLERFAAFVDGDRGLEIDLARLEPLDDLLELGECRLEAHSRNVRNNGVIHLSGPLPRPAPR